MKEAAEQALLRAIIENGWAEPQGEKYAQKLRETDPDIRRILGMERPKLAEAHITARYNEDHVHEFSRLPKQVVEALMQFLDVTRQSDFTFVHLVTHEPDATMFPSSYTVNGQSTQRIVFITPSLINLATDASKLFLGHHSRYMLEGLALELVTRGTSVDTRLHLKVAAWTKDSHQHPRHHFGIITVETDGTISYERIALELNLHFVAEACFGVKPKESLISARQIPTPPGKTAKLDTLFPGAKDRLAEDLQHLPSFMSEIAQVVVRPVRVPGF